MTDFTLNRDNRFDLQLSESVLRERELGDLFASGKIELKTETWQWRRTGKICIEFRQRGKPSGIAVSEADVWIHRLNDDNGKPLIYLMFPLERLKMLARQAHASGNYRLGGGDDGQFDNILIPLHGLVDWLLQGNEQ